MKQEVSVCVICKNEEDCIERCLKSVSWADEIIVVDSGSTDRTVEISKKYTDRVMFHEWPGYVSQKNYAMSLAAKEWVFSLDADEECSDKLRDEILRVLDAGDAADGYEMRRHAFYFGKWINHCGWYPDWKLRLARRAKARWAGRDPHDKLVVDGMVRRIHADINHYNYRDFAQQLKTIDSFSSIVSKQWYDDGRRFNLLSTLAHPVYKMFETYIWKGGILDGIPGLIISAASAFYVFSKHVKLLEIQRSNESSAGHS